MPNSLKKKKKKSLKWVQGAESTAELRGKELRVVEQRGLSWCGDKFPGCWPPPLAGTRSLPTHLAKLLFIFIFCFGFYWHFLSSLLTVSNRIGTDEVREDQLEPPHYSCLSNSGVSVSCPLLPSDPSSPCLPDIALYPPLTVCLCLCPYALVLRGGW